MLELALEMELNYGQESQLLSQPISRKPSKPHARRCLLRTRPINLNGKRKDQAKHDQRTALGIPQAGCI